MARKLTIIRAQPGAGKTFATVEEIVDRVMRGQKAAVTTPNHKNAQKYELAFSRRRVSTVYRMAPHRMTRMGGGPPLCKFVDEGEMLADSGLSVKRELCEGASARGHSDPNDPLRVSRKGIPCDYISECPAALGERRLPKGVTHPSVMIAPHQLVHESVEFLGPCDLLVIDEPPEPIEVRILGAADFEAAHYAATILADGSKLALIAKAIEAGVRANAEGDMRAILKAGAGAMGLGAKEIDLRLLLAGIRGEGPVEERLSAAITKAMPGGRGKLQAASLLKVRASLVDRILSRGAQALGAIVRALEGGDHEPFSGIVDGKLVIVEESHHLRQALMRCVNGSPTVLLDATCDLTLLKAFMVNFVQKDIENLDAVIEVVEANVVDAAPIERRWLYSASANKKSWLPHGRLELSHFVGPLRRAIEIAAEDPARLRLGIIAYKAITPHVDAAWKAGGDPSGLSETQRAIWECLAPWRARAGAQLQTLHYGNLRGTNEMEEDDVLICLGDPWSERTAAQLAAAVLNIRFEELYRAAARAELEQAVGRIRAACRTKPGAIVVVGSIPPGGWTAENTVIEELKMGAPRVGAAGARWDVILAWIAELGLSRRQAARLLGIDEGTIRNREREAAQHASAPAAEGSAGGSGAEKVLSRIDPLSLSVALIPHPESACPPAAAEKVLSREGEIRPSTRIGPSEGEIGKSLSRDLKAAPIPTGAETYEQAGLGDLLAEGRVAFGGEFADRGGRGCRPSIVRRALGITYRVQPFDPARIEAAASIY